ncbi:hypothetical protein FPV67DRAFT_1667867 [Lyophyllum atratum]|nr:hypothetical protein FPV67DRAFT_1667867 [Lyophyllum atratum]
MVLVYVSEMRNVFPDFELSSSAITALDKNNMVPKETAAIPPDPSVTVYAIIKEVKKLMARSAKVDEAFQSLKEGLGEVDKRILHFDNDGDTVGKLQPTWIKYQERFVSLCELSSDHAKAAQENTRVFAKVILPSMLSETASIAQKHETLTHFFERAHTGNKSDDHTEATAALRQDVQSFLKKYSTYPNEKMAADAQLLYDELDAGLLERISGFSWIWELAHSDGMLLRESDLGRIGTCEELKARIENMKSTYTILECTLQEFAEQVGKCSRLEFWIDVLDDTNATHTGFQ